MYRFIDGRDALVDTIRKHHVNLVIQAADVLSTTGLAMLFGFVFSKTDEHLQGRVATVISAPAQVLSMFCSGIAGSLLPAAGFTTTTSFFLAALAASALIALLTPAIKTIPKSNNWENTQL